MGNASGSWASPWLLHKEPVHLFVAGLSKSGKNSILRTMKMKPPFYTTVQPAVKVHQQRNISAYSITIDDSGVLPSCQLYLKPNLAGLIFVIDSSADESTQNVAVFHALLEACPKNIPILILANKQDIKGAIRADEVINTLELANLSPEVHSWLVQPCCAFDEENLYEGLSWLSSGAPISEQARAYTKRFRTTKSAMK